MLTCLCYAVQIYFFFCLKATNGYYSGHSCCTQLSPNTSSVKTVVAKYECRDCF